MPMYAIPVLLGLSAAANDDLAPLRIEERTEYVDIAAANLDEVVDVIRGRRPHADGRVVRLHTQGALDVTYRLVPDGDGCRVEDIGLVLEVTMRVPRWTPPGAVRPAVREQWERMDAGMHIHERGHRDNAVAMAQDTLRRLQALAGEALPDCTKTARRILRERYAAQVRYASRDEAYDRRTRHGISQMPPAADGARDRTAQR